MKSATPDNSARKQDAMAFLAAFKSLPSAIKETASLTTAIYFATDDREIKQGWILDMNFLLRVDEDVYNDIIKMIKTLLIHHQEKRERLDAKYEESKERRRNCPVHGTKKSDGPGLFEAIFVTSMMDAMSKDESEDDKKEEPKPEQKEEPKQ